MAALPRNPPGRVSLSSHHQLSVFLSRDSHFYLLSPHLHHAVLSSLCSHHCSEPLVPRPPPTFLWCYFSVLIATSLSSTGGRWHFLLFQVHPCFGSCDTHLPGFPPAFSLPCLPLGHPCWHSWQTSRYQLVPGSLRACLLDRLVESYGFLHLCVLSSPGSRLHPVCSV